MTANQEPGTDEETSVPAGATAREAGSPGRSGFRATARSWLRRPLVWFGGIVVAALGVAITNALVPTFGSFIGSITEQGPPIDVIDATPFKSDEVGGSMVFADGGTVTAEDLAELNAADDQFAWLIHRGGVPLDAAFVRLVLEGNRTEAVRIIDAEVDRDCAAPLDGVIFLDPPAGADQSIRLNFDLDAQDPTATYRTEDGSTAQFFPAQTISLAEDEQLTLVVTASSREQYCTFAVVLSVLEGDRTTEVRIPEAGARPFAVTARLDDAQYEAVYLGGVICSDGFVRAGDAYFSGDTDRMCDG
jgi:hypothetical protein